MKILSFDSTAIFIYLAIFGAVALVILVCWLMLFKQIYQRLKDMNKRKKQNQ